MKSVSTKFIKVFTDGTISFTSACLKSKKQVIFYEKDKINSLFFQKARKKKSFQNSLSISYKSKYKI